MKDTSGAVWKDVSCPLCTAGTASKDYLLCGDRLKNPALRNYSLLSCNGCGLIFLSPRPSLDLTLSHHLQEGYDPFVSFSEKLTLTDRLYILARKITSRWKRRLISRMIPPGSSVLDIGCGTGEFLYSIRDIMTVTGLEPEPGAGDWGRQKYGLDIRTGTTASVEFPAASFDLITLWHALEHIPEPLEALRYARSLLKQGGKVLLALPNVDSFDAYFYGADWVALDAPRHLWHFTPETVEVIASRAGMKCVVKGILPLDHFYNVLLSEGIYLASGRGNKLLAPMRMAYALSGSIFRSLISGQGSGMYYILEI